MPAFAALPYARHVHPEAWLSPVHKFSCSPTCFRRTGAAPAPARKVDPRHRARPRPPRRSTRGAMASGARGAAARVVFSDLDGTLVHYPKELLEYATIAPCDAASATVTVTYNHTGEARECVTLRSKTGGESYMSLRTRHLIAELRAAGVVFVIITGARSSTYMGRRPLLPPADFEFFENGGRKLAAGVLDPAWTDRFVAEVGPILDRSALLPELPPVEKRDGSLWQLYRQLAHDGWKIDTRDYMTNIRVDVKKSEGKTASQFQAIVENECPKRALASSFNLGKGDIYPRGSGKANAARHILDTLAIDAMDAIALFDDDNDLELGALVGRSFLPGVTHPSVLEALKHQPTWTLTEQRGVLGTESALETILALRKESLRGGKTAVSSK